MIANGQEIRQFVNHFLSVICEIPCGGNFNGRKNTILASQLWRPGFISDIRVLLPDVEPA